MKQSLNLCMTGSNVTGTGSLTTGGDWNRAWGFDQTYIGDVFWPSDRWWERTPNVWPPTWPNTTTTDTTILWSYPMYDRHSVTKDIKSETHYFELAGLGREFITVSVEDNQLKIKANGVIKDVEIKYEHSVAMPHNVDLDRIQCNYDNGMVVIVLNYIAPKVKYLELK